MKTRLVAALALALVAGLLGLKFFRPGPIHIAAILPLTGEDAAIGLGMRNSMQLAVDEANALGGIQKRKVALTVIDDQSDREKSALAFVHLAEDKTIVASLENYDPECAINVGKLNAAALPNLIAGTVYCDPGKFNPLDFRVLPVSFALLMQSALYAWNTLGARHFVYIRDDTKTGAAQVKAFRRALGYVKNGTVSGGDIPIARGATDFTAAVAKVRAEAADYVLFSGRPLEAGLFLSQLRAAGFTGWFQSATPFPSPELIEIAKDKAEGALQAFPGVPPEDLPAGKAFLQAYAAHGFKEPPASFGLYGYAAAQVVLSALERSFVTRPSIAGALAHEQFQSAIGPVAFAPTDEEEDDHVHDLPTYKTVAIYQVVHGRWVPIAATEKEKLQPYPAK